jgi:hypothetical protein
MKLINLLFVIVILAGACSSPKKTTTKGAVPTATPAETPADKLRGGSSFNNAVVIMVENERAGLDEEYKWLANYFPGYSLIRRTHVKRSSRHYDIVRIKTKQGQVKNIYFDSTRFWGKH